MTPMMHERVRNMFGDAGLTTGFTVQQLILVIEQDDAKLFMFKRCQLNHHTPPYIIRGAELNATLVVPADNITRLVKDTGFTLGKHGHVRTPVQ